MHAPARTPSVCCAVGCIGVLCTVMCLPVSRVVLSRIVQVQKSILRPGEAFDVEWCSLHTFSDCSLALYPTEPAAAAAVVTASTYNEFRGVVSMKLPVRAKPGNYRLCYLDPKGEPLQSLRLRVLTGTLSLTLKEEALCAGDHLSVTWSDQQQADFEKYDGWLANLEVHPGAARPIAITNQVIALHQLCEWVACTRTGLRLGVGPTDERRDEGWECRRRECEREGGRVRTACHPPPRPRWVVLVFVCAFVIVFDLRCAHLCCMGVLLRCIGNASCAPQARCRCRRVIEL